MVRVTADQIVTAAAAAAAANGELRLFGREPAVVVLVGRIVDIDADDSELVLFDVESRDWGRDATTSSTVQVLLDIDSPDAAARVLDMSKGMDVRVTGKLREAVVVCLDMRPIDDPAEIEYHHLHATHAQLVFDAETEWADAAAAEAAEAAAIAPPAVESF